MSKGRPPEAVWPVEAEGHGALSAPARVVWRYASHRTPGVPRPALTNGSSLVRPPPRRTCRGSRLTSPRRTPPGFDSRAHGLPGFPRTSVAPRLLIENPSRVQLREFWGGHGPMPRLLARSALPLLHLKADRRDHFTMRQENRSAAEIVSRRLPAGRAQRGNLRSCLPRLRWLGIGHEWRWSWSLAAAPHLGFDAGRRTVAQRR